MVGTLQPLVRNQPIINEDGTPTEYFIRWCQERQIDITQGISAAEAQALIDAWAATRDIIAGVALDGGGNLSADVTIDHANSTVTPGSYGDATHIPQLTVNQQGHVTGVTNVAITGGGGGGIIVAAAQSGKYYAPDTLSFGSGNANTAANSIALYPFSKSMAISGIAMEVNTGIAQNIQLALYTSHPTTGLPYQLVQASGSISTSATGIKTFTLTSPNAYPGKTVWLARNASGVISMRNSIKTNWGAGIIGNTAINQISTDTFTALSVATTFGTWPSDLTGSTFTGLDTVVMVVAVA